MVRSIKKTVSFFLVLIIMASSAICTYAYDIDDIVQAATAWIFRMEGTYDSINANDNGAVSIGKVQWHGSRALQLLKTIVEANPSQAKELLGETLYNEIIDSKPADWNYRWFNSEEVAIFKKLLATDESKKAQDDLAYSDVKSYIVRAQSMGITDGKALVYFADLENQMGSGGVTRVAKAAIALAGSGADVTLDILYQAALADSVAASSPTRRRTTYEYCRSLSFGDVENTNNFKTGKYKTTASYLRVRSGPGVIFDTVASGIPEGTVIEVLEVSGDWGKIVYYGTTGWVSLLYADYLDGDSTPDVKPDVKHDVNGNGQVDAADARMALRSAASLETLTAEQKKAADTDGNGNITAADARTILRIAAKIQ